MAAAATATRSARSASRKAPARAPGGRSAPASRPSGRTRPRAEARRAAARPRRGVTPAAGFMIPAAAVGRTAVAVGDLADSGLMVRLTRSRLWIGLVGALLVGIVALNVLALGFSASGSRLARQAEGLEGENSALRAQLTKRLSNERIQGTAGELGLTAPEPGSIRYLDAAPRDAAAAAKRLRQGALSATSATSVEAVPPPEGVSQVAPAESTPPAAPATATPPATEAVTAEPAPAPPAG